MWNSEVLPVAFLAAVAVISFAVTAADVVTSRNYGALLLRLMSAILRLMSASYENVNGRTGLSAATYNAGLAGRITPY